MKNLPIKFKIIYCFGIIMVLLLISGIVTFRRIKSVKDNDNLIDHTYQILSQIEIVYGSLKDAQIGERGFVITGDKDYLTHYNSALKQIPDQLKELTLLVNDEQQKELLNEISNTIPLAIEILNRPISLRESNGFDAAQKFVMTDTIKSSFDHIRTVMDEMINYRKSLLTQRKILTVKSTMYTKISILGILIFGFFLVAFLSFYLTNIIAKPIKEMSEMADRDC